MVVYYNRYERVTEYFELPLNQEVIEAIVANFVRGESSKFDVVFGKTRCSPKDKMNKKLGKEYAQKAAKKRKLTIFSIVVADKKVSIIFRENLVVTQFKDSGKIIVHATGPTV